MESRMSHLFSIRSTGVVLALSTALVFALPCVSGAGDNLFPGFGVTYLNYVVPMGVDGNAEILASSWKLSDLAALSAPLVRQMQNRDLTWNNMEATNDAFTYARAQEIIQPGNGVNFIVSLFYENGAKSDLRLSPWGSDSAADRFDYVSTVVNHFKDTVRFWEIGNENSHSWLTGKMTPQAYATLLAEIAPTIRALDTNAIIILSGLHNPEDSLGNTGDGPTVWLDQVLTALGTNVNNCIDVVDGHLYGNWYRIPDQVRYIRTVLDAHGCDAEIMVGENGVSSEPGNETPLAGTDNRTQAGMVFTRMTLAVGAGAAHSSWFSHANGVGTNYMHGFRGYGTVWHDPDETRETNIVHKPSWFSLRLLFRELLNFSSAEMIAEGDGATGAGNYLIKFEVDHSPKFVGWNMGGGVVTLSNLTERVALIESVVCDTVLATNGVLVDQWPVPDVHGEVAFAHTIQTVTNGMLTLTLTNTPQIVSFPEATLAAPGVPDNLFEFSMHGSAGQTYSIESSTNLSAWDPWQSVRLSGGQTNLSDEIHDGTPHFYRAVWNASLP